MCQKMIQYMLSYEIHVLNIEFLKNLNLEYTSQIIAMFSGALIAILSSYLTYRFSVNQEYAKDKRIYRKNLNIIDSNLDWQINQIDRLENSLSILHETSLKEGQITIDKFPTTFNIRILQNSINNLTEYKESDELLLRTLIFYLNHIEDFNYQLEFINANKIISTLKDEKRIEIGINDFFASLKKEYIEKLKYEIKLMKNFIIKEQMKYK